MPIFFQGIKSLSEDAFRGLALSGGGKASGNVLKKQLVLRLTIGKLRIDIPGNICYTRHSLPRPKRGIAGRPAGLRQKPASAAEGGLSDE